MNRPSNAKTPTNTQPTTRNGNQSTRSYRAERTGTTTNCPPTTAKD
jgi:hypothetical protein